MASVEVVVAVVVLSISHQDVDVAADDSDDMDAALYAFEDGHFHSGSDVSISPSASGEEEAADVAAECAEAVEDEEAVPLPEAALGEPARGSRDDPRPCARARPPTAERRAGMLLLAEYVRGVRAEEAFRHSTARVIVDEALARVRRAGLEFWGAAGCFTRRRTVLDSFLAYEYASL